jgi:hypothetical protein
MRCRATGGNEGGDGGYASVARLYDPQCDVNDSLPGGDLNPSQRHFVNNVWLQNVRRRLIAGGFWQLTTIA